MTRIKTTAHSIDTYIAGFPPNVRRRLQSIRAMIKKEAPEIQETIAYGIPTFVLNGNLVHFAGYEKHVGFYPAPSGIAAFKQELAGYVHAKGSVQFSHDLPLPMSLIAKIVRFRIAENMGKKAE